MKMPTIEERIVVLICDTIGVAEGDVTDDASFVDELGADSLDLLEFSMRMEDEFDIQIPDEEAEYITTPKEAADYIKSQIGVDT